MAARAIWKGELKIGSARIPVKLYSGVVDRTVHFNILDQKHLMRVRQHMVSRDTDEEVSNEEIQKGYEIEPGRFVVLTEEELENLEPKPSREIEIREFVHPKRSARNGMKGPTTSGQTVMICCCSLYATRKR